MFDDEDLAAAGLTAAERAAIDADEDDADALAELARDGDGEGDGNGEGEGGNTASDDAAAAAAPAAAAAASADDDAPIAVYRAEAPADADAQLAAIQAKEDAAFAKLMDGEIEAHVYKAEQAALQAQRNEIVQAQIKASISEEMRAQAAEESWNRACAKFISAANTNEGIDYRGNKVLGRAFDEAVRELAADPANAQQPASFFLEEAHKVVKSAFGRAPAPSPSPAAAPAPKPASRKPDLSQVPPTLANLPVAKDAAVSDDEFAHMRHLTANDLERAIAGLTPAQLDRYMAD